MSKGIYKYTLIAQAMLLVSSCKKPYVPGVITSDPGILVVEGSINTGADSTIIHLTHTIPLSSPAKTTLPPEQNAIVTVESDANTVYPLTERGNGYYITTGLSLSANNKYRLKIVTTKNQTYESDFVEVKNSPPIDSVSFQALNTGVQVNVSTHDPSNNSRYYRYEYQETWIIHADYDSALKLVKGNDGLGNTTYNVILRNQQDEIYQCWTSDSSSSIVLGSTANLTKDVLANAPVTFIDSHSEKISSRYSILVKQHALTKEAFEYYQQLSKNTEKIGSIFDPQPTILNGNIHNINNRSEQVIGYITAGASVQKRIFINKYALPTTLQYLPTLPYNSCFIDSLYFLDPKTGANDVDNDLYHGYAVPLWAIQQPGGPLLGYAASGGICVDCTLRGTNIKPAFWVDQ